MLPPETNRIPGTPPVAVALNAAPRMRRSATVLLTLVLFGCASSIPGEGPTDTLLPAQGVQVEAVATPSFDPSSAQTEDQSDAVVVISSIVGLALGAALLVWIFGKLGG
jgi:hypothetical protein